MITLPEHVELISHLPSPFSNLKSLKIYPYDVFSMEPEVHVSTEVKNFLIGSSPGVTFTVVPREKGCSKTNMTELENRMVTTYDKVEVENNSWAEADTKMKGEGITHVNNYWKDLDAQLKEGFKFSGHINSLLADMEAVLPDLPTSHRHKLQKRFSGLFAEVETVMSSMMNRMRIQCDKTPSRSIVSFHELATASQPSNFN
ncbi:hypothetical protein QVD17_04187 [Tagetes erecta]|uniref:Uncharacterized protein n=1 Tax=Tagetes erecta TaxID=13708 RepID=A0AAD8PA93_TARER|nr:hypothetical protein QVD17_04187 [Tagetes erecta]